MDQGLGDYLIKKKTLWIKVCLGFYDFLSEKKTLFIYRFGGFSERYKIILDIGFGDSLKVQYNIVHLIVLGIF